MAVPIYVWNGTAWESTGPTIPASPIKYQASAPTSPSTGDIWVDSDADVTSGSQQFQRFRFVASGGETTISGADANGAVLAYTAGAELVVLNGSTLVRGQDYTATNGTSITSLSPALVANDVLEVFSFIVFNVANTYTQAQVDGLLDSYVGLRLITPTSVTNGTIGATGAVTFSGVTSVSLDGCFTSKYDNYKILISCKTGSSVDQMFMRLRTSNADNTTSNYYYSTFGLDSSAAAIALAKGDPQSYFRIGATATDTSLTEITISEPFTSNKTSYSQNSTLGSGTNEAHFEVGGGFFSGTTSFDGFTFYMSSLTLTGTVRVYGYKN